MYIIMNLIILSARDKYALSVSIPRPCTNPWIENCHWRLNNKICRDGVIMYLGYISLEIYRKRLHSHIFSNSVFLVNKETPLLVNNKYFIIALFIRLTTHFHWNNLLNGVNTNVIFSDQLVLDKRTLINRAQYQFAFFPPFWRRCKCGVKMVFTTEHDV